MSTRCRIGIKNKNGTITSIYCHHDGYPSYVGKRLFENYKDEAKIRQLMELGDISSLGTEPIDNPRAWEDTLHAILNSESWDKVYAEIHPNNMCDTYKSRGEDCPARKSINEKAYKELADESWGEYVYLFKNGKWYISYSDVDFIDLEIKLKTI